MRTHTHICARWSPEANTVQTQVAIRQRSPLCWKLKRRLKERFRLGNDFFCQEMWKKISHSSNRVCTQIVDMQQLENRRWLEGVRFACRALAIEALPPTSIYTHTHTHTHSYTRNMSLIALDMMKTTDASPAQMTAGKVHSQSWETNVAMGHWIMKVTWCITPFPPDPAVAYYKDHLKKKKKKKTQQ